MRKRSGITVDKMIDKDTPTHLWSLFTLVRYKRENIVLQEFQVGTHRILSEKKERIPTSYKVLYVYSIKETGQ